MKTPEKLRLEYLDPEPCESGMRLQLLEMGSHRPPFKSSRFTIERGGSSPPDKHSVAEMWIVVEGAGELVYDSRKLEVKGGDAVYFEPFHMHQIFNHSAETLKVLSFWWDD